MCDEDIQKLSSLQNIISFEIKVDGIDKARTIHRREVKHNGNFRVPEAILQN